MHACVKTKNFERTTGSSSARRDGKGSAAECQVNSPTSIRVQAIAAPEKPTSEPFTAWATAIERIPKRTDLKTIMILGAGPIVIGQVRCRQ